MNDHCLFIQSLHLHSITSAQETLISANLMAISQKKNMNIFTEFNAEKNIEKLNFFKSQKLQILANAHHYGFELEKSHLKSIINTNSINESTPTKTSEFYGFASLKTDVAKATGKKDRKKKGPVSLDKERWMPLRDRSYYKTKAQYIKAQKTTSKVNKK